MKNVKAKAWWKAAGVRAVKTVAQTAIASVGTAAVMSQVDWKLAVSASVLAGVISLLTSIAGLPEVKDDEELTPPIGVEKANATEKGSGSTE